MQKLLQAVFFISIDKFSELFNDLKENILKNLAELDGIGETQTEAIDTIFSNKRIKKLLVI